MTREEFWRQVNLEAARLYGGAERSDEILSDWLEAKIIEAHPKQGRKRVWTEDQLQEALEILRLNSLGVTILGEIRFHLWLRNPAIPLFAEQFDPRGLLIREFIPLRNQMMKPIRSTYPDGRNFSPNGWPAKSVLRGMGELDVTLRPFVNYSPTELLGGYTALRFGQMTTNFSDAVGRLAIALFNGLRGKLPGGTDVTEFPTVTDLVTECFAGALAQSGEPENPIVRSIRLATDADFLLARRAFNKCEFMFSLFGLQKVANSLRHPNWQVALFVLFLHIIRRGSGMRLGITPQSLDLIEEYISKNTIKATT